MAHTGDLLDALGYNQTNQLAAPNKHTMSRVIHQVIFFITFVLGVFALAICTNALVKRNHEIGAANETLPPGGKRESGANSR